MTYGEKSLQGVNILHVDDILYFGTETFQNSVKVFKKTFKFSREEQEAFNSVGITITQEKNAIVLDQKEYLNSVKMELLPKMTGKNKLAYANEDVCVLSTIQSKP